MNIDEQRLQQFFNELKAKREAFAENYKYFAPQLAPQFNCFDFIDSDENKLSEIIAHLLNPQATHAQNDLFLQLFFKKIEIKYPDCDQQVTVNCEVVTHSIKNNQRRIDILVDFKKDCFGLAIENKPWAGDQNKQLSDYNEHLGNIYGNKYCLIYLSGNDSDPSSESISEEKRNELEENKQYKKINFSDIVSWLEQCEKESKSDHVKHFLRDFIAYCQQEFSGVTNMNDEKLIKDFILRDKANLELALVIEQQTLSVKKKLSSDFSIKLIEEFEKEYKDWKYYFDKGFFYEELDKCICFHKQVWKTYCLAIGRDAGGLYLGIKKQSGNKIEKNITSGLKELQEGETSSYWWWSYFPEEYAKPWIGIISVEETVKIAMAKIKALITASEKFINDAEEEAKKAQNTPTEAEKQP